MSCVGLTSMECSVQLASQQDTKLFFMIFFFALSAFFIWYYKKDRINDIEKIYYFVSIVVSRFMSYAYVILSPFAFMIYRYSVNFDLAISYFLLFYLPTTITIMLMSFLWVLDGIFIKLGYEGAFDFYKKATGKF